MVRLFEVEHSHVILWNGYIIQFGFQSFTDGQRQHLSAETMEVLYDKYTSKQDSVTTDKNKENTDSVASEASW